MNQKVAVVGAGAMGTACAWVLAHQPHVSVGLWARNVTFAGHIAETRENSRLLPGVRLPAHVDVSADAERILRDAEIVVVCIPTRGIRQAMSILKPSVRPGAMEGKRGNMRGSAWHAVS